MTLSAWFVCDGRMWGRTPPTELLDLGVAASTRGYEPHQLTHYKAGWVKGADQYPLPAYPLDLNGEVIDKEWLRTKCIAPWKALEAKGSRGDGGRIWGIQPNTARGSFFPG